MRKLRAKDMYTVAFFEAKQPDIQAKIFLIQDSSDTIDMYVEGQESVPRPCVELSFVRIDIVRNETNNCSVKAEKELVKPGPYASPSS